ncbi:MAG: hypothetical protein GWO16_08405 [Gammaproteobacteria bacterium]|nr:hypothetical protein [Gammaproteobacteria bacterium]NIR97970.1 hypothetical protein [Gammaproteobacteria bacterium]NIT63670.1 hypothetical protein [Gammaproteobacteria bacterium]NIV21528.1 hypothetical protein [Gammaproteobacteria bacterium]NIY32250.1 hypothetical protein [Gammaproteobacteria bacterium]
MAAADPITAGLTFGRELLERLWPDPQDRAEGERQLLALAQTGELRAMATRARVVVAEAKSDGVLARNWRPATMLTLVALIVARWMGWTEAGISEALELELLGLIKLGLGGYVIGRSVEKVGRPALGRLAEAVRGRG